MSEIRKRRQKFVGVLAFFAISAMAATTHAATVTYSYVGNNYDTILDGSLFTTGMNITGSFTLTLDPFTDLARIIHAVRLI